MYANAIYSIVCIYAKVLFYTVGVVCLRVTHRHTTYCVCPCNVCVCARTCECVCRVCVCVCVCMGVWVCLYITIDNLHHPHLYGTCSKIHITITMVICSLGSLCVGDAVRYWQDNIIIISNYCLPFG